LNRIAWIVAAAATIAAAAKPPEVGLIDLESYQRLVSGKSGKVVVVNMWATWCEPCREEFPTLVRFHRESAGRRVELMTVSLDMTADIESKVKPFLAEQGATFPSYVKKPGGDNEFINAIDPAWSGALPATFIYDARGNLARSILTPVSLDELNDTVSSLLESD